MNVPEMVDVKIKVYRHRRGCYFVGPHVLFNLLDVRNAIQPGYEVDPIVAAELFRLELHLLQSPFRCPKCGGRTFGVCDGLLSLDRVECHDEFGKRCRWKGSRVGAEYTGN